VRSQAYQRTTEAIVKFDERFQDTQAKKTQSVLVPIAKTVGVNPTGWNNASDAGLKTKATTSRATVTL